MLDSVDDGQSRGEEPEKSAADAGWLVDGGEEKTKPPGSPAAPSLPPDEAYDIVGLEADEAHDSPSMPPVPVPPVRTPKAKPKADGAKRSESGPAPEVDRVWTRWDEWGPDILRLAGAGVGLLFLLYLCFSAGSFSLAFLFFALGGVGMVALGYPILITLERPVRIVPEQAVADYYAALSHALPHYRRMWLLLSSAGRSSPHFTTFEGFRAYWKEKLLALSGPGAGHLNALTFAVAEFQSERSSGLTEVEVKFTLNVTKRDRPDQPVASYPLEIGLVKGPDRMWYLNTGTLPGGRG